MLVWVVDCWSKTANSVLARQHDYPVLAIPAGIERRVLFGRLSSLASLGILVAVVSTD